jgi:dephospho-CoA kinase
MLRVGLTGGYASGKSLVAGELARLGCHVIYADALGHATLLPDGGAYQAVVDAFGSQILSAEGKIDRKKLAAMVFASPDLLSQLNGFVHPAVWKLEEDQLRQMAVREPHGIAVVEAAILIETGRYTAFDKLILTSCSVETQIARGMLRDGATRAQVMARIDKQMPLETKTRYAHYVIDTEGSEEATRRHTEAVYLDLRKLAEAAA